MTTHITKTWFDRENIIRQTIPEAETYKSPWVGLTKEQKDSLLLPFGSYWVIDAIEAKLKENNGV